MCGIAGIVGLSPVNQAAVRAMTDLMVHRGPDGEGQWITEDQRICLGHRRLSIIDLSERAAQPMHSADGSITITYNGEIYNYRELRQTLEQHGCRFRTDCDTEVIVEAYRIWGEDCLDQFNGMFAFAIHDREREILFCARDRFGEKPFLFSARSGFFAFASEYKALLALDGVGTEIDDGMLMRFFVNPANGPDQSRNTLFREIQQLLPGEKLTLRLTDLTCDISRYWDVPANPERARITEADAADHLRTLLQNAVEIRMRSDVRVGSCLSGGVDSSAITCIARELTGDAPYHVFTGRFPNSAADEGKWADIVVQETGVTPHEAFPSAADLVGEMDDFLWLNELPVDSTSQYAQWSVFRRAKQEDVTVLLDGQGSDEILGGYEQYFSAYIRSRRQDGSYDAAEEAAIRARYPGAFSEADQAWKKALPASLRRTAARLLGRGSNPVFGMKREFANAAAEAEQPVGTLQDALRTSSFNGFLTTLLRYGDRNSMAHSREVRLPFCDHRIYGFVSTLPPEMIMGHAQTKFLLREAMRDILPEPVRTRWGKQGFLPPIVDWLKGDLFTLAEDIVHSEALRTGPHWDQRWWKNALARFGAGDPTPASSIWKVMISELWREKFLGRLNARTTVPPLA